jgi:phosphopantetheinyl transferase
MVEITTFPHFEVRIWNGASSAPVSDHPNRSLLRLESRRTEFDKIEQCLLPKWSYHDVFKDSKGKPYLRDGTHVSISHSGDYAAVAISTIPVGIDIQVQSPLLFKVRSKFCHPMELSQLSPSPEDELYLKIWCAKEAIFKINGQGGNFAKDIFCSDLNETSNFLTFHQQIEGNKLQDVGVHFLKKTNYFVAIAQTL